MSLPKRKKSEQLGGDHQMEMELEVQKKIGKLENKLKEMERAIEKWDKKDVDLNFALDEDDEINTAYLVKSRMVDRYMKFYKMLCALRKHSPVNTGRPIHKRITVENVTRFAEVNEAIFRHLNVQISKDSYYFPDFPEILDIVEKVKDKKLLVAGDYEIRQMAKTLFERIVVILKKRRRKDFCIVLPAKEIEDPAEEDQELAKKLEENKSKGRREDDVIREFVEKQTEESEEIDLGDEDSTSSVASEDEDNAVAHNEGDDCGDDSDVLILSDEDVSPSSPILPNKNDDSDSDIEIVSVISGCT